MTAAPKKIRNVIETAVASALKCQPYGIKMTTVIQMELDVEWDDEGTVEADIPKAPVKVNYGIGRDKATTAKLYMKIQT